MKTKENQTMNHTPTPWEVDNGKININGIERKIIRSGGVIIAETFGLNAKTAQEAEANAEFIVRAVNAHEELVGALKQTLDALYNETVGKSNSPWIAETKLKAKEALAKAEGKG